MRIGLQFVVLASLAPAFGGCTGSVNSDAGADVRTEDATLDVTLDATIDDGPSDGPLRCTTDLDCADGVFCNGAERCAPGVAGADARGCIGGSSPCRTDMTCDESALRCSSTCEDADGDGHRAASCGGDDCDDADANRFPGNPEVCRLDPSTMSRVDPTHDEDCDANTYASGTALDGDFDHDGFIDGACCNRDGSGGLHCGNDCADVAGVMVAAPYTGTMPPEAIHPTQPDVCNGVDDNCNGRVDDGLPSNTYSQDCDGDGYGDPAVPAVVGCSVDAFPPCMGHPRVPNSGDCDDSDPAVHPGALEVCDMGNVDEDCDGTPNPGCACTGTMARTCCAGRGSQSCASGTWGPCSVLPVAEVCNGLDDDCDGTVDDGIATMSCYDGAAATRGVGACRGGMRTCSGGTFGGCVGQVLPAAETCNSIDDDCDGTVDGGLHSWRTPVSYSALTNASSCTSGNRFGSVDCMLQLGRTCGTPPSGVCRATVPAFGPLEQNVDMFEVMCPAGGTAISLPGGMGTLTAINPSCNDTDPSARVACWSAADRFCRSRGFEAGYGPSTDGLGVRQVVCLASTEAAYFSGVSWPQLSAQGTGCAAPSDAIGPGCAAASSRYCASRGFLGGFGPVEFGTADAHVVCVRRF